MKLFFSGEISELVNGISALSNEMGFEITSDGFKVAVEKIRENKLQVLMQKNSAIIRYHERIHFFRALGLLIENSDKGMEFNICEAPQFTMNGVMIDVSQSNLGKG